MKMPRVLNAAYELSPFVQRNRDEVLRLRETLTAISQRSRRSRNPARELGVVAQKSPRDDMEPYSAYTLLSFPPNKDSS